jgi:aminoglycoside 2'-N-acetyltransferase I
VTEQSIGPVAHAALTDRDRTGLQRLFDGEYFEEFGDWDPDQPYGYAPHDVHLIAWSGDRVAGHVGWGRRRIRVGGKVVEIAGVGGVLVSESARGQRLGEQLMNATRRSMSDVDEIQFGYLGCREEVVPFYRACGWHRISAGERSLSRDGRSNEYPPGQPLLILPLGSSLEDWPTGIVNLCGRAW